MTGRDCFGLQSPVFVPVMQHKFVGHVWLQSSPRDNNLLNVIKDEKRGEISSVL